MRVTAAHALTHTRMHARSARNYSRKNHNSIYCIYTLCRPVRPKRECGPKGSLVCVCVAGRRTGPGIYSYTSIFCVGISLISFNASNSIYSRPLVCGHLRFVVLLHSSAASGSILRSLTHRSPAPSHPSVCVFVYIAQSRRRHKSMPAFAFLRVNSKPRSYLIFIFPTNKYC